MNSENTTARGATDVGVSPRTPPGVPPIYQTTVFGLDETTYEDIRTTGGLKEYWYSRFRNPTVDAAAAGIARLEGAEAAVMTSSGMAAISTTLLTLLRAGDHLLAAKELYGDSRELIGRDLVRFGVEVDFLSVDVPSAWRIEIERRGATVLYAETLSNPQLRLLDIPVMAELAHYAGAKLVVDNTFATPYSVRPLQLGADVVINSATKYLSGHSDVTAGCIASSLKLAEDCQRTVITLGCCLDPHSAFLVRRGLQTFEIRLARQTASAEKVVDFLSGRPEVAQVIYPGLQTYPQNELADRILAPGRRGAMIAAVLEGGDKRAYEFMRKLPVIREATSLGGVESLVSMPITSSQFSFSEIELSEVGIVPGMVRISVGLEDPEDIIRDLRQALTAGPP